jgi:type IV secretory pathway VirB2 component (pilin)
MKRNITLVLVFLAIAAMPHYGFATTSFVQVERLACAIANVVGGNIAKAIATIGIVFLGARAFVGKLDWPTVLIVALGVFIVFGFKPIVETVASFAGKSSFDVSNCPTS